ncbi:O-antigen ligase [Bacterioplanoides sp. SCSIO 12839]|uniref:O-antigen ligase family protein n=1 Tax=Bacterioplanoides sp. SCSIO 12839 TaxID=2829569 RepID=UPI002106DD89|nr:O-antigen ligase family protein [Bacterioplanoides sp. SCSIO 12839]UTW48026.1 O-antigen ligase family protein [Bacterioplanoides sp. SCSIO 12839]
MFLSFSRQDYSPLQKGILGMFMFLILMMFVAIHYDARPAQSQLTYGTWIFLSALVFQRFNSLQEREKGFVIFLMAYCSWSLFVYALHGDFREPYVRSQLIYPLVLGVVLVLSAFSIDRKFLVMILFVALIASSSVFLREYLNGGVRGDSEHGVPIVYGNLSLMSGIILFCLSFDRQLDNKYRALAFLGFFLGLSASLWSESRGGWLLIPLVVAALLVIKIVYQKSSRIKFFLIFMLFMSLCLAISVSFYDSLDKRFNEAVNDIELYLSGENKNTSVGLRFEMWKVALYSIKESPLVGVGPSGFHDNRNILKQSGAVADRVRYYEHAHNDFLWVLSTKGVVGILFYLSVFVYLFRCYWICFKDPGKTWLALSGLFVCLGYLIFSLSDIFLSVKMGIGYFIIVNALIFRVLNTERVVEV